MFALKLNTNGRIIRPIDIIVEMHEQHGVQLLYTTAWRAKEHAKNILYGKPEDSYQLLPAYFHLLKVTNLGTLTAIHTDENNNFLYTFFSLGQCIKGFQTVIRSVIAIDATHLNGAFEGVIYVASCKDGDEHAYPIAFGVGDGEVESSWIWFLERLREAIGEVEGMLLVSDRHVSIAKARWFNDRREKAGKNPTYLGKAAVGHCKERNEWSLTYHVYPIELTRYLDKDGKYDGLVDIEQRTCTCRNWDLDQLPCDHAIAVARRQLDLSKAVIEGNFEDKDPTNHFVA
ncbi:hypothetical protein Q3G72_011463 [Acer saccharum]|nr:hypothetical protein Q3G72_011463 [Acer saccharum]